MKRALLIAHGTAGDVFPFVWLGRMLQASGCECTLISSQEFKAFINGTGLGFHPLRGDNFKETLAAPDRLKPWAGTHSCFRFAGRATGTIADTVEEWMKANGKPDILFAPSICFGARLVREKHGIALVTTHLSPLSIHSIHSPPLFLPRLKWLRWLPYRLRHLFLSGPSPFEASAMPAVKEHCERLGVRPPKRLREEWWDSPDGSLALYPEWFAVPQPDWPTNLLQLDFPLEDLAPTTGGLSPRLKKFLAQGEPPVVFTAGSFNFKASPFFKVATETVRQTGCRAVLVCSRFDQVPADLGDRIIATEYEPFSQLLPNALAFVHRGGIGTLSQGLAAGVPQIVIPEVNDQHDNAERLARLGAGTILSSRSLNVRALARAIGKGIRDFQFKQRATEYSAMRRSKDTKEVLASWMQSCLKRAVK